jgi:hypothetical protein
MSPVEVGWDAANARRLRRHGLVSDARHADAPAAVGAMVGAHAQVQSAGEHSVALRTEDSTRSEIQRALWEDRALVRVHGPRGTVHLLRTTDLPMWTAALGAVPEQSPFPDDVRLTPTQTEAVVSAIGDALRDAELTLDELGDEVVRRTGPWAGDRVMPAFQDVWPRWRQALDAAAHRGMVCFGPQRGRRVTYTSPRRWRSDLTPAPPDEAVGWLIRKYLRAYGPATSQQFAQWLGSPPRWAAAQLEARRGDLAVVSFDGVPAYVAGDDSRFEEGRPASGVVLLPYFDAFVVGCHPRARLFPGRASGRALSPSGQAGNFPVLLVDGVVAGVWHQRRQGRRIIVTVEPVVPLTRRRSAALDDEVERLGRILDGVPALTVGPVAVGPHA